MRNALRLVTIGFAALAGGCGPSGPKMVPVSGTVTFDGGRVPGPGFVYFTTDGEPGSLARPGTAEFDADGRYRAKTFTDGDGLLPGKYRLRVDCWKSPPNMAGRPVSSFLPNRYQNAAESKLELEVKPDDRSLTFDFDLKGM